MKTIAAIRRTLLWLFAVALIARITAITAWAAAPAPPTLQGQVTLRPLTPGEIQAYALKDAQRASGLSTIPVGAPAYLELLVNNAIPAADITNVSFMLSSKPID